MKIEWEWLDQKLGLHRISSGEMSIYNIVENNIVLEATDEYEELLYLIDDYSRVTNRTLDDEELASVSELTSLRARSKDQLRIAIVSRKTEESIAAANHFCDLMKQCHYECAAFQSYEEALAWAAKT